MKPLTVEDLDRSWQRSEIAVKLILGKSTQEYNDYFCNYSDRIIKYAEIKVYYLKQKYLKAKEERSKQHPDIEVQKIPQ